MSVNKAIIVGCLGKDPEMRRTAEGTSAANFSIATSESWKDKDGQKQERTEWHSVVAFGALAEVCRKHLRKGTKVYVEGRLETSEWTDRDGVKRRATKVRTTCIELLGREADRKQGGGKAMGTREPGEEG